MQAPAVPFSTLAAPACWRRRRLPTCLLACLPPYLLPACLPWPAEYNPLPTVVLVCNAVSWFSYSLASRDPYIACRRAPRLGALLGPTPAGPAC